MRRKKKRREWKGRERKRKRREKGNKEKEHLLLAVWRDGIILVRVFIQVVEAREVAEILYIVTGAESVAATLSGSWLPLVPNQV